MSKYVLVVRDRNLLKPPLLITTEAAAVEVYDMNNELVAVMHPVLENNYWGVTAKSDPDWHECLAQLGYIGTKLDLDPARKKSFFENG